MLLPVGTNALLTYLLHEALHPLLPLLNIRFERWHDGDRASRLDRLQHTGSDDLFHKPSHPAAGTLEEENAPNNACLFYQSLPTPQLPPYNQR